MRLDQLLEQENAELAQKLARLELRHQALRDKYLDALKELKQLRIMSRKHDANAVDITPEAEKPEV